MNEMPTTAVAISSERTPVRLRRLEELDDDDALAIGRVFSRPSNALVVSILGFGVAMVFGAITFGLSAGAGVAAGMALAGGVGLAGQRRTREVLRIELSISDADADRLFAATNAWSTVRLRRPNTDAELQTLGYEILRIARSRNP